MMFKPMPHQIDGYKFLLKNSGFKLLHWDMGAGKTACAILAVQEVEGPFLVLVKAVAVPHWKREFEKVLVDDPRTVQVIKSAKDKIEGDIIIVSHPMSCRPIMRSALEEIGFQNVILDEVQVYKNIASLRTKATLGYGHFRNRSLLRNAKNIWCLSGTPAPNNLSEMYAWLRAFLPDLMPRTLEKFIQTYLESYPTPWGRTITGNNNETVPELMEKLAPYFFRIKKEDVLHDLPPMQIADIPVDGGVLMKQIWDSESKFKDEILAALDGAYPTEHVATLRRLVELAKVPAVLQLVDAELEDNTYEKLVIFAHHRDVITDLVDGLKGWGVSCVHGGITGSAREREIDSFQNGDNRVFVGQLLAAGTSIDLHAGGRCTNAITLSLSWTPADNAQAFSRIHRKGQTNSVYIRVLHLADSLDQHVSQTLARKTRMLNEIFGETNAAA